jgi:DNA-binding beta-propeller fold protein YncE
MTRPYGLLRAGFPYVKCVGMRRVTNQSMDVAIGKDYTLYVLSRTGAIARLTLDDDDLRPIAGGGEDDGKFVWPVAMLIDDDENLWISDESLNRISVITTEGEFVRKWGEAGEGDGQLNGVSGISFDPEGDVYVADTLNHRVQKFTNEGKFLLKWGGLGDAEGQFNMPWGIKVDELGDVYVADWRNDRVQKFNAEGKFLFAFGSSGSEKGQFNRPAGVEVDADGDIYIADAGNDRVQQFNVDGLYMEQFLGDATLSKSMRRYVLSNGRTLRLREMASDLEAQKRFRNPRSIRLDDQARMYVADFGSFRIQIYQKDVVPLAEGEIDVPLRAPTLFTT